MLGIEVSLPEFAASSRGSKLSWEPSCSMLPGFLPQSSGAGTCSSFGLRPAVDQGGGVPEGLCCLLECGHLLGPLHRAVPLGKAGTLCRRSLSRWG